MKIIDGESGKKGGRINAHIPVDLLEEGKAQAIGFLTNLKVRKDDIVVMVGAVNPCLPQEVRKKGANLVYRELDDNKVEKVRISVERATACPGEADVKVGDFTQLEGNSLAKLVFLPHLVDDPRIRAARPAIVKRACELVKSDGHLAASLDGVEVGAREFEEIASKTGFRLEYVDSLHYDTGQNNSAHVWRVRKK